MNWKSWFDFGYGLPEWKRDRHLIWSAFVGWLIVDTPAVIALIEGSSDWKPFLHNGLVLMVPAIVGVLKNLSANNDAVNQPHADDRFAVVKAILPADKERP